MALVPLTAEEAHQLLSEMPVEPTITADDLDLIRLVAKGHTATEIARALNLSTRTVYRYVARLRTDFSVSSMEALATELARRGF
jgi:DNA-binding NarL/FixJ family response regulator